MLHRTPLWIRRLTLTLLLVVTGAVATRAAEDDRPVVTDKDAALTPATAPTTLPTLFLVGDSTMNSNAPLRGWASEVAPYFDAKKINVVVRAIGGRSSKTFQTEGRWGRVLGEMKSGDFVVVQFGHNDVGRYDDPNAKGRPSLHGEGEETADWTKPDGTKEIVHTFGWYMRKYGADAKEKGATVIFASMVPHKDWSPDGKTIRRGEKDKWVLWTKNAAEANGAIFVDHNQIIATEFEKLGQEKVEAFFGDKRTHFSPEGAKFAARSFIAGINALPANPLAAYENETGKGVEPAKQ